MCQSPGDVRRIQSARSVRVTAVCSTGIGAFGGKSILDDPQDLP